MSSYLDSFNISVKTEAQAAGLGGKRYILRIMGGQSYIEVNERPRYPILHFIWLESLKAG